MTTMRFLDFVGTSALSSNLLFYLSEWAELNSLYQRVSPPTIQHLALVLLATHNLISLFHAYAFLNWALYVIHFLGFLLHVSFIAIYIQLTRYRKRFSLHLLCAVLFLVASLTYVTSLDESTKKTQLESLCHWVGGVALFLTPALSLFNAFRNDNNECISVWITSSLLWSSSLSFLYGFLVKDNAMQLAHIPCIATCLISMGFVWHHDKKKMEELKSLLDEKSQEKKDE